MSKKVGIIYCQKIQDSSCIGCAKCYKAINEKAFVFEGEEDVQLVFKTSCGDCPGLVLPKAQLQMTVIDKLGTGVDEIYFATCVKKGEGSHDLPFEP